MKNLVLSNGSEHLRNNLFYFRQLRSISLKKQNKQKQRQEAHMYKRHAYLQITPEEYDCSTRNTWTSDGGTILKVGGAQSLSSFFIYSA